MAPAVRGEDRSYCDRQSFGTVRAALRDVAVDEARRLQQSFVNLTDSASVNGTARTAMPLPSRTAMAQPRHR